MYNGKSVEVTKKNNPALKDICQEIGMSSCSNRKIMMASVEARPEYVHFVGGKGSSRLGPFPQVDAAWQTTRAMCQGVIVKGR